MNEFIFIVFDLDKILALTNVNKFPFASLNRIFAVTLYPNSGFIFYGKLP